MQALSEKIFELSPPGGVFNTTVVRNLFPDISDGARTLLVHRAVTAGEVITLKPGLYTLAPIYRKSELHPFALAGLLHSPSHISLESALAYHQFIPEAVFQVSSVTMGRSRKFNTPLGVFQFWRVPLKRPRLGVEAIEVSKGVWSFVATPLRAIADLIYLRRNVNWESDGIDFLLESLRIDIESLKSIRDKDYKTMMEAFDNGRVAAYLKGMYERLKK